MEEINKIIEEFAKKDVELMKDSEKKKIIKKKRRNYFLMPIICFVLAIILFPFAFPEIFNTVLEESIQMIFVYLFLVFAITAIITIFISVIRYAINRKYFLIDLCKEKYRKSSNLVLEEKLLNVSQQDSEYLARNRFNVTESLDIKTTKTMSANSNLSIKFLIDENNFKFVFKLGTNKYSKIYDFKDLIAFNFGEKIVNSSNEKSKGPARFILELGLAVLTDGIFDGTPNKTETVTKVKNKFAILKIKSDGDNAESILLPYVYGKNIDINSKLYANLNENIKEFNHLLEKITITWSIHSKSKTKLNGNFRTKTSWVHCKFCGARTDGDKAKCANCGASL